MFWNVLVVVEGIPMTKSFLDIIEVHPKQKGKEVELVPIEDSRNTDFTRCEHCGHWVHYTQEFCLRCMSDEDKWRLGVL
jgi:uncharacterized OB-fold protein